MKYYVVFKGKNPGIYTSWKKCEEQVSGIKGSVYKSFEKKSDAELAYKDYVNEMSNKVKKTEFRNVFSGGYSVMLPFELNEQQKKVIDQIHEFITNPNEFVMTVSGWAGTGKTTLMEIVNSRYWMTHTIHFAATTHKAAGVLKEKVKKKVMTVNSLFGIIVETDMDGEAYDMQKKTTKMSEDKVKDNSIIIIDEASMLSIQNYISVVRTAAERHCKIIFVGDSAQLSPVNENDISIVFRNTATRITELTEVMRTDDDGILSEACHIRKYGIFTYENSGDSVRFIKESDSKEISSVIDKYISGLKSDPNYFRILSYTNANVERLNKVIRKKLGYGNFPERGEPLMAYGNWGYEGMSSMGTNYKITNSEAYTVIDTVDEYEEDVTHMITYIMDCDTDDLNLYITEIEIEDQTGTKKIVPFIDVKNNEKNLEIVKALALEKVHQWNLYRECQGNMQKKKCLDKINAIDNFLFVNDNVYDEYGNLIQAKMIDFGYAHTIHKSQGSTFSHVLINDSDISRCLDENVRSQLRYVALTRAKKSANVIIRT